MAIMWGVLAFIGAAVVGMLLSELHESASMVARFVIRRASRRLPAAIRDERRDDWLAELEAMEGLHIVRLAFALGLVVASLKIAWEWRNVPASAAASATSYNARLTLPFGLMIDRRGTELRISNMFLEKLS